MSPEQKQELHQKNQEHLAKKRAKRDAIAAAKKHQKQPATAKATQPTERAAESPKATERVTLQALKARVKETWPEAKHLADAKRDELVALVERGDAELFKQYQETWAKRSKVRYDAWFRGDSKSAQALKAKRKASA